jgi:hypothetical protein
MRASILAKIGDGCSSFSPGHRPDRFKTGKEHMACQPEGMFVSRRDEVRNGIDFSFLTPKGCLAHSRRGHAPSRPRRQLSGGARISSAHDPVVRRSLGVFLRLLCPFRLGVGLCALRGRFAGLLGELLLPGLFVSDDVLGREDNGGWGASQHGGLGDGIDVCDLRMDDFQGDCGPGEVRVLGLSCEVFKAYFYSNCVSMTTPLSDNNVDSIRISPQLRGSRDPQARANRFWTENKMFQGSDYRWPPLLEVHKVKGVPIVCSTSIEQLLRKIHECLL